MSKYIIELNDKCARGIVVFGKKDEEVISTTQYVENLEVLNSDYINEHFGDLQDTAYQRGLEDGKKATFGLVADASNAEYQRGFEDGKAVNNNGCEGCRYSGTPQGDSPCFNCSNYYSNNWTAKQTDDEIKVGDEVNWLGDCFIVTRIFQPHNMKEQCDGIDDDGCVYHDVLMDDIEKTGRHFDIASILEDMKHD